MIITLSGTPGSGKSLIAKTVSQKLGYTRVYMGGLRRELARKKGMTIDELNKLGETDPSSDEEIDEIMRKIAYAQDRLFIESRTAAALFKKWGVEKDTIHLFLKCDPVVASKRIFKQKQEEGAEERNEVMPENIEAQLMEIEDRTANDSRRYMKHYGFDCYDEKWYDIVIDTTKLNKEEAINTVLEAIKKKAKEKFNIEV